MKKILFSLVLLFVGQVIYAQDLNQLMDDLAKVEKAQKQVMDRDMLNNSMSDAQKAKLPDFMSKADSVVAVIVENCPQDVNDKIQEGIRKAETNNDYELLTAVKKEDNRVSILSSKNEGENKDVYIYVGAGNVVVFVKLSGKFTIDDLANIVKEQQKDNNN